MSDDINNGTAKTREEWIDMLRGFGILLVIIGLTAMVSAVPVHQRYLFVLFRTAE